MRYAAAGLPGDVVTPVLSNKQLFGLGLRSTLLSAAAFAVIGLVVYVVAGFRWSDHSEEWRDVDMAHGVRNAKRLRSPIGQRRR